MKYQIVVHRKLLGYGQFVTEGRDEVNTITMQGEDRPFIFASKLRAVERRTIMKKVREVLKVNCYLEVHEKGKESGISGLCLSCPACWLFGGTYAPGANKVQVTEKTKVFYSDAYPFEKIPIEDKTFNAVDEKRNITGQALGVNQIIGPGGDFINVIDLETDNEDWVKLIVWGIKHSERYGANVRIYGQMKNEIVGVIKSEQLEVSAWELANKFKNIDEVKAHLEKDYKEKLLDLKEDVKIDDLIQKLDNSEEVKNLKERRRKRTKTENNEEEGKEEGKQ